MCHIHSTLTSVIAACPHSPSDIMGTSLCTRVLVHSFSFQSLKPVYTYPGEHQSSQQLLGWWIWTRLPKPHQISWQLWYSFQNCQSSWQLWCSFQNCQSLIRAHGNCGVLFKTVKASSELMATVVRTAAIMPA